MRLIPSSPAGLGALVVLSLSTSAAAHSWIEAAYKINTKTRMFFGSPGYSRGGDFRRISAEDPNFSDEDFILRIPSNGIYSGDENINKQPTTAKQPDATLEAAPGDFIAILHTENGHVTLKEQDRPQNGGNIYMYGTSEPKDEDKLLDIHLLWNEDGTGGDGRGRLLGTSNYDDGQCYEAKPGPFSTQRAAALKGANPDVGLTCQSDIQLPEDLKPGSTYTIYWYWDWPRLNTAEIDMERTKDGVFPWMGTFMRGEKDPNGFTQSVLTANESYASTLDIKIVDKSDSSESQALNNEQLQGEEDVYKMGIEKQIKEGGFAFKVDQNQGGGGGGGGGDGGAGDTPSPTSPGSTPSATPTDAVPTGAPQESGDGKETVTVTKTVEAPAPTTPCGPMSTKTIEEVVTSTKTVQPGDSADEKAGGETSMSSEEPSPAATSTLPMDITSNFAQPTPTPSPLRRRSRWSFGDY